MMTFIILNIFIILIIVIILYILYKILKNILKFIFLKEKMSIKILSNFFNLYEILKKFEKYQNKFINQEKKWSNYYIINRILYFILSIISFFIFSMGFIFYLFNLLIYIFIIYRFLNYLYLNYYYSFFSLNFFIKILILIFFCIYIIFVFKILIKFFIKIYIYINIFYKFFTCQGTSNIFSVISNQILLNHYNNMQNIKNFIRKKVNKIFNFEVDESEVGESIIIQSINSKWYNIYKKSLLLKFIIIISYIIKFLIKCLIYCFLICTIYNLYDTTYTSLLFSIGQIKNEIINSSSFVAKFLLIFKFINLKIYIYFYIISNYIYINKLFLGIPYILLNIVAFILPINNYNWFTSKLNEFAIENTVENFTFENISEFLVPKHEIINHMAIFLISFFICFIILFFILKLILKFFFFIRYYSKYNIKILILNIPARKLLLDKKLVLYLFLRRYKRNYMYKGKLSLGFFKNYLENYFSKDPYFDLQFSNILLTIYILPFLFSKEDYKLYKKLKKIRKLKLITETLKKHLQQYDGESRYPEPIVLDKNFYIKNSYINQL